MKSFDLERALAGDPVVTREGGKVIEILVTKTNETYPLIVSIEKEGGYHLYSKSGHRIYLGTSNEKYDLLMESKKIRFCVVIKKQPDGRLNGLPFHEIHHTVYHLEEFVNHTDILAQLSLDKNKYHVLECEIET